MAGNLIGQHGGSGRPPKSDRKAKMSWTETRGSSGCRMSTTTYYSPQLHCSDSPSEEFSD